MGQEIQDLFGFAGIVADEDFGRSIEQLRTQRRFRGLSGLVSEALDEVLPLFANGGGLLVELFRLLMVLVQGEDLLEVVQPFALILELLEIGSAEFEGGLHLLGLVTQLTCYQQLELEYAYDGRPLAPLGEPPSSPFELLRGVWVGDDVVVTGQYVLETVVRIFVLGVVFQSIKVIAKVVVHLLPPSMARVASEQAPCPAAQRTHPLERSDFRYTSCSPFGVVRPHEARRLDRLS